MSNFNNSSEIKNFLLNHKREFQEYLNKKSSDIACFNCCIHNIHKTELQNSCIGIYEHFATSLGKEPRIDLLTFTCVDLYRELVRLASNE